MKHNMKTCSALILSLSLVFLQVAECQRTYIAPNMSWSEAFIHCRDRNSGKLATISAEEWKKNGVPSELAAADWVWVGALFLESHTWNPFTGKGADLWEHMGCYNLPESPLNHKKADGPYECYERCSRSQRSRSPLYLFLKGRNCGCSSKLPEIHFRADPKKCDFLCHKSFHWCGGSDRFFSVYALSDGLKVEKSIWEGPCFRGVFNGSLNGKWILHIENSSCDANATAACVLPNRTVSLFTGKDFTRVSDFCKDLNSSLPLAFCSNGSASNELCDFGIYKENGISPTALLERFFWLSLNRSESSYWIDGRPFVDKNLQRSSSRCIAMKATDNVTVDFKVTTCLASLRALCSYEDQEAPKHTELAIIAGAGGVGALLAFVLLTVVLVCLKRSGKLRTSTASRTTFRSTSRSSDVTQSDHQGTARGQRSCTATETSDETSHMITSILAGSQDAAKSTQAGHSEYVNVIETDIGLSVLRPTDGIYSECDELSMLPPTRAETTKDVWDRNRLSKNAPDDEYTNAKSLDSACGGVGLHEVSATLQTAESVDNWVYNNTSSRQPEHESSAGTSANGSVALQPAGVLQNSRGADTTELLYAQVRKPRTSDKFK